jgi:hypothetical protein
MMRIPNTKRLELQQFIALVSHHMGTVHNLSYHRWVFTYCVLQPPCQNLGPLYLGSFLCIPITY